jgi:hypothetical protein
VTVPSTNLDPGDTSGWAITDPVVQLRVFGSDQVFALTEGELGAAAECAIQLRDPAGLISRRHASLAREGDVWVLRDLASRNGVRHDGELRQTMQLGAGVELGLGDVRLIVESPRLVALRELLARVIGWSRGVAVDDAVQAVRKATIWRSGLLLCGAGDLTGVARRIHEHVVGADQPFVVCAGELAVPALEHAATLCLAGKKPARDLPELAAAMRLPGRKPRTIVCAPASADVPDVMAMLAKAAMIELPALATRQDELACIIDAYAADAVTALGAASTGFREHEHRWLAAAGPETLEQVEELALRVVALRNWGVSGGSAKLGITHGALSTWASRRRIPT